MEVSSQTKQHGAIDRQSLSLPCSESILSGLLQSSHDGILIIDRQCRYTHWSDSMETISGMKTEQVVGRCAFEVFPFLQSIGEEALFQAALNGETVHSPERTFFIPETQRTGCFEATYSPIRNREGEVIAALGIVREISERRKRQQAERRLEAEHAVAQVLCETLTLEEAAPRILRPLCEVIPADIASIWLLDKKDSTLFCAASFISGDATSMEPFLQATQNLRFDRGISLPGMVWALEKLIHLPDLQKEKNFHRQKAALQCGLQNGFAVPVVFGSTVLGVLEFFSREKVEPDAHLSRMFTALGRDIAQFIQRRRAEHQVKRLNQTLARRVSELETLLQVMPVGVAITKDARCERMTANAAFAEMLGMEPGQNISLSGPNASALPFKVYRNGEPFPPSEMPMQIAAATGKRPSPIECEVIFADNTKKHFLITAAPLFDENKKVRGAIGVHIDITRRRQIEESLKSSQRQLADFVENASEGLHWVGPDGLVIWANKAELNLLGYTAEDYIGRHISEFHEDQGAVNDILSRLCHGEELINVEARLRAKDGSIKNVLINSSVYRENGKFIHTRCFTRDITERKRVEAQLRASESRFRALFEQSPLAIQIFSPDGNLLRLNAAWEKLWGVKGADATGYNILADPQLAAKGVLPAVKRALNGETITIPAVKYDPAEIQRPGRPRWVEAFLYPIKDEVGAVRELVLILEDVTKRIEAEQSLRDKEAQSRYLAAVVESSDDAIISKDLDGRITNWNQAAARIYGYTSEEMIGRQGSRIIPQDRLDEEAELFRQIGKGRQIDHLETIRITKDGRRLDVSLTISPIKDADGNIVGASKIARDITEKKRAEEALKQSEARFRELAEAIPHIVWTANGDGTLDYCNERWKQYTGLGFEGKRPELWSKVVHPEFNHLVSGLWEQAAQSGELFEMEYPLRASDGSYRWHLDRAVPLKDSDGKTIRWFGTCTDIHEKKNAEEMVLQLNQELERRVEERTTALVEINDQMESFCYSVSHDLRAPVRAMRAFTQVLLDDYSTVLDAAAHDYLNRIGTAAERMDRLIQDLLHYSRLGRMQITLGPVAPAKAIEAVLLDLRLEIKQKEAIIEVQPPLPLVKAHETILEQIFLNLLSNALKFIPDGITPSIRIWSETNGQTVRIHIRDNGIGISPEHHKRIFEMFERLHGAQDYPGTGIGLAIVQKGISRMNGCLGLESSSGKGSCFWFELPAAPPGDGSAQTPDFRESEQDPATPPHNA